MEDIKENVSKMAAARRQLETAIELWFFDKDAVSIHTLAAAAYQIIHDVNEQRGKPGELLYDANCIKPEYRGKITAMLKKPVNYFKHADRDADEIMEFSPLETLGFIMFSLSGLQILGEPFSDYGYALSLWLALHEPDLVMDDYRADVQKCAPVGGFGDIRRMEKGEFLKTFLRLRAEARAKGLI